MLLTAVLLVATIGTVGPTVTPPVIRDTFGRVGAVNVTVVARVCREKERQKIS